MADLSDAGLTYARSLLASSREELERADAKASIVLAGAGIFLAALSAGLIAGDLSPFDVWNGIEWLLWLSSALALVGIAALGDCIFPRTGRQVGLRRVEFFKDVLRTAPDDLADAIEDAAADESAALLGQLVATAQIANRKYRDLRLALASFALAGVTGAVAVLIDHVVRF